MGVPATTGQLRTKIADMKIGDYIACNYEVTGNVFTFLTSTSGLTEIPVIGMAQGAGNKGFIYLIKSSRGVLISDRVMVHTLTWDFLNTRKEIQGRPLTLDGVTGVLRSLTGGVAYADANGNMSLTDKGLGGFPTNNEWDRYIVNFPTDKIQSGKTVDDVFHWKGIWTWTQDTPSNSMKDRLNTVGINTTRVHRGNVSLNDLVLSGSTGSVSTLGFRPVFEYQEV